MHKSPHGRDLATSKTMATQSERGAPLDPDLDVIGMVESRRQSGSSKDRARPSQVKVGQKRLLADAFIEERRARKKSHNTKSPPQSHRNSSARTLSVHASSDRHLEAPSCSYHTSPAVTKSLIEHVPLRSHLGDSDQGDISQNGDRSEESLEKNVASDTDTMAGPPDVSAESPCV